MRSSATRSIGSAARLADFVKLIDVFERHDVTFVSITQQFNTTTSMG